MLCNVNIVGRAHDLIWLFERHYSSTDDKMWWDATLIVDGVPTFTGRGAKKGLARNEASRQYLLANGLIAPAPLE